MQKNALQDLPACALALSIFMNMPVAAQTIKVGDAGSGSAVHKQIVECHAGKIWVESEP